MVPGEYAQPPGIKPVPFPDIPYPPGTPPGSQNQHPVRGKGEYPLYGNRGIAPRSGSRQIKTGAGYDVGEICAPPASVMAPSSSRCITIITLRGFRHICPVIQGSGQ